MSTHLRICIACAVWSIGLLAAACSEGGGGTVAPSADGSFGVTQAGAQDIALFRQIVDDGGVPSSETLDQVGFFAEHAVDLPAANCGATLCVHPMLAVAPRFDGGNWTMAFIGLNTSTDPAELERPPIHLGVAIEQGLLSQYTQLSLGLSELAAALRPSDRVTVTVFGAATVLSEVLEPSTLADDADDILLDLVSILGSTSGNRGAELYAAIASTAEVITQFEGAAQLVLLTSGSAYGISDTERVVGLCEAYARQGLAISVIGAAGPGGYQADIPQAIAEIGAGNYYYAEDNADLRQILAVEGATTLFPLATDFELTVSAGSAYRTGRIYGAERAFGVGGAVRITLPALFIGHRTGSTDVDEGRRGGGGGLFVELIADPSLGALIANAAAFDVEASWVNPNTGEVEEVEGTVINPLVPGENPDDMWPHFSDPARGKIFMMLNMYLTLNAAVRFYESGDCARALGVIDMVEPTVYAFQEEYDDPDIDADLALILQLRDNLGDACTAIVPVEPQGDFAGSCMLI